MIKDVNGRFDKLDRFYYIGAMDQWKIIYFDLFLYQLKLSYYLFNRQELLQKAKDRYHNCSGKEKAAEYYIANKAALKENAKNKYRSMSEEEK